MTKIYACFIEVEYRRVSGEEGSYDAFAGYGVIAQAEVDGLTHSYLFIGANRKAPEGQHAWAHIFGTREAAERFVARVQAAGEINLDRWDLVQISDPNELPDYVTNPHRPEYN